jgi:beta-glucosidase
VAELASKKFPKGFFWGAATSAYQVEGGNKYSDWEHWRVRAGRACDQYHRFEEDFSIASSLNQNSHRFSIEWARIEPEKGEFSRKEVAHYRAVLESLHRRKITPLVTLHHFTNPLWVAERGGWENPSTVGYFEEYVRYIVTQLADLCNFWITINEPWVYLSEGYFYGRWPPEKRNPFVALLVGRRLLEAHRRAYRLIHQIQPKAQVGIAYSLSCARTPLRINPLSWWEQAAIRQARVQDFIGVNYYRSVGLGDSLPRTDLGWEIYPQGLYEVLLGLKQFDLPVYITENGLADSKDEKRANYIADHLMAARRALAEGVKVKGYFHWSLLDNFEWARGFEPRFGLVEMDYETMKRRVRPSAKVYAKIAKQNSL